MMRELSLFTGGGGGVYASKLLGHTIIGYVEFNEYCQKIIKQRIEDGIFDNAPIFGDIREFDGTPYCGTVDLVSGGFPCQPFSVAGRKKGKDDSRNMWPETIRVINEIKPKEAFLENVPGLLSSGYFGTILNDLFKAGYDARWITLSASDCGAPHKRERLWILAYSNTQYDGFTTTEKRESSEERNDSNEKGQKSTSESKGLGILADTDSSWQLQSERLEQNQRGWISNDGQEISNTDGANVERLRQSSRYEATIPKLEQSSWWAVEPDVGRVAHGVASRKHRLTALGNGQVPIVAARAYRILKATTNEETKELLK